MKWASLILFSIILIVCCSGLNAVSINNSVFNTTKSNSSITFDLKVNMTNITCYDNNITIINLTCPNLFFFPKYVWFTLNKNINISQVCVFPTSGGGGGAEEIDKTKVCNYTYTYLQKYGKNESQINNYTNNLSINGIAIRVDIFKNYVLNWDYYCSNLMNKTSNDTIICSMIYYSIINEGKLDNLSIEKIRISLQPSIVSNNLVYSYYRDFERRCKMIKKLPILENNLTEESCDFSLTKIVLGFPLNTSMNFIKIPLEDKSCENLNDYKWFFRIDKETKSLDGLRVWWIFLVLIIIILVIVFLHLNRKIGLMKKLRMNAKKIIDKIKNKNIKNKKDLE